MTTLPESASGQSIFSRKFLVLFAAVFLAYANISVFFQFYGHLRTLPIDPEWFGFLIGVFSAVSLIARPVVSSWMHEDNARGYLILGALLASASLGAYSLTQGLWSMMLVRVFHGLAFTVLGAALMTMFVGHIPQEASARFFGFMSVVLLLPNTVVPPLWPFLEKTLGGFNHVLLFFAGLLILVIPLVGFIKRTDSAAGERRLAGKLSRSDIWRNLADPKIILILTAMLLFYCGHALVFFFLAAYAAKIGVAGIGFFFTLTTVGEIGVRVTVGNYFDRVDKILLAVITMACLAVGYALLGMARHEYLFYALGAYLGLGWGVAMPVFNGLMFDLSRPELRAFNSNLGLQMFQAGFFVGPFIGGFVAAQLGFSALFQLCAVLSLASAAFTLGLRRRVR